MSHAVDARAWNAAILRFFLLLWHEVVPTERSNERAAGQSGPDHAAAATTTVEQPIRHPLRASHDGSHPAPRTPALPRPRPRTLKLEAQCPAPGTIPPTSSPSSMRRPHPRAPQAPTRAAGAPLLRREHHRPDANQHSLTGPDTSQNHRPRKPRFAPTRIRQVPRRPAALISRPSSWPRSTIAHSIALATSSHPDSKPGQPQSHRARTDECSTPAAPREPGPSPSTRSTNTPPRDHSLQQNTPGGKLWFKRDQLDAWRRHHTIPHADEPVAAATRCHATTPSRRHRSVALPKCSIRLASTSTSHLRHAGEQGNSRLQSQRRGRDSNPRWSLTPILA